MQDAVEQMDAHAGHMMKTRPDAEQLAVQHVRKPGQRMPVGGMGAD